MHFFIIHTLLYLIFLSPINSRIISGNYETARINFIEDEALHSVGGKIQLTKEEQKVNNILMDLKEKEFGNVFENPHLFNFSKHYFTYRDQMKNSEVYQIIKSMPKGAVLHVHSTFMMDADYLLSLTYEEYLHVCYTSDNLLFHFSYNTPQRPCSTEWALISDLRNASDDVDLFDSEIHSYLSMNSNIEENTDPDINAVWKEFDRVYATIKSLITYRPVREKYIYDSLKRFYSDNIFYLEARSGLHKLYELNGTEYEGIYMVKLHQEVTNRFIADHPDFVGMKFIISKHRSSDIDVIRQQMKASLEIKNDLPDMFAGFDLVGQEDKGKPLKDFIPVLMEMKGEMNFYFHGGETNWYGTESDENLIDAVLLGAKRIGHAYALTKHPSVMAAVVKKDIALEVNVISNRMLALVTDVRNHPLATFLAFGLPVVLSSDDPGVWGAEPLSHDFYIAFVAVASKRADLRMLKQLAINSMKYTALENGDKIKLYKIFFNRWNIFLKLVIAAYS